MRTCLSVLATLALLVAAGCAARSTAPRACPSHSETFASGTVIEIGDGLADFGKTIDGTPLGTCVELRLMVTPRAGRNVEIVIGGEGRALRIPITKTDSILASGTWSVVNAAPPRPYSEARDAFEGAPPFHGSDVLLSYRTFTHWDEAWLVTREGNALVVWLATGPYEDVTTEGATWERFVLVSLAAGAEVSAS